MQKISIGALGGTIVMVADEGHQGVVPKWDAAGLVCSVPDIEGLAAFHAETLAQLPSGALDFDLGFKVLEWARNQVGQGASGIVITQGTDTLEEMAYFLHLYWDLPEPLVVTGAMRAPQMTGADGPVNLLASVRVALDEGARNRGVLVVMNDEVHSPRFVHKSHTIALDTFISSDTGPVGRLYEGKIRYFIPPLQQRKIMPPAQNTDHHVGLYEAAMGDKSGHLDLLLSSGRFAGLVIAGFGAGHVSFEDADRLANFAATLPIVVASHTGSGPTTTATYGYKGSEMDLQQKGCIMAGWLQPLKARILLWSLLATPLSLEDLPNLWQEWTAL